MGCDLTRRDLQNMAKRHGRPWDTAKGFDRSAPIGHIYPIDGNNSNNLPIIDKNRIWLSVNNEEKQNSTIDKMIWDVSNIISFLSNEFELQAGDLIYTGTPSGVGPIEKNDVVTGGIDGLGQISFRIV